jgi:hemerythrin
MVDLVWHEFYELGVDFIDEDHKKLLALMVEIRAAVKDSNFEACTVLLMDLLESAKLHFDREENYLESVGWDGLAEHRGYHQELLKQADVMRAICAGIQESHDLQECFDSMAKFLIDDILRGDIKFKSYLSYHDYT